MFFSWTLSQGDCRSFVLCSGTGCLGLGSQETQHELLFLLLPPCRSRLLTPALFPCCHFRDKVEECSSLGCKLRCQQRLVRMSACGVGAVRPMSGVGMCCRSSARVDSQLHGAVEKLIAMKLLVTLWWFPCLGFSEICRVWRSSAAWIWRTCF